MLSSVLSKLYIHTYTSTVNRKSSFATKHMSHDALTKSSKTEKSNAIKSIIKEDIKISFPRNVLYFFPYSKKK